MFRTRIAALVTALSAPLLGPALALAQENPPETTYPTTEPAETQPEQQPAPAQTTVNPNTNITIEQPPPPQPTVVAPTPVPVPVEVEKDDGRPDWGMGVSVGGGVTEFTNSGPRSVTDVGAQGEARLTLGTRSILAAEVGYVGTLRDIAALGLDDDAMLVSNGIEGALRVNLGRFDFQPYVLGGVGWNRYSVVNASFNTSDVRDGDNVIALPVGGGISTYLGASGFMVDGRFAYRFSFDNDLLAEGTDSADSNRRSRLDNWSATLRLGYEF